MLLSAVLEFATELDVELDVTGQTLQPVLTNIVVLVIEAELVHAERVYSSLTEPIDDLHAKDPKAIREARRTICWTEWLAVIYEGLESLKVKGVYEDVDQLPSSTRTESY